MSCIRPLRSARPPRLSGPLLASCGTALLLGCASPPPQPMPLAVQPLLRLQQSGDQSAAAWYRLGKYHQERGQTSLAMGAYAQSLALDGRQLDARMAVAAIDARQGRLAEARDALLALVDDYPAQAQLSNNLGYVYHLMGDQQAAIAMLRRALALDAASSRAQDNLRLAEAAALRGASTATLAALAPAQSLPAAAMPEAAATSAAPASVAVTLPMAAAAPAAATVPVAVSASVAAAVPVAVAASAAVSASAAAAVPVTVAVPAAVAASVAAAVPVAAAASVVGPAQADADAGLPPPTRAELRALQEQLRRLELRSEAALQTAASPPPVPETAAGAGAAPMRVRVDITNGNGVQGLAKRWRSALAQAGIPVGHLSNDAPYRQKTTVIEYRPGLRNEASALQQALPGNVTLQEAGPHASARLRLVLGRDMRSAPALAVAPPSGRLLTADNDQ